MKLTDFGLSYWEVHVDLLDIPLGSPRFMAPEMARVVSGGRRRALLSADSQCDSYTMGEPLDAVLVALFYTAWVEGELSLRCRLLLNNLKSKHHFARHTTYDLVALPSLEEVWDFRCRLEDHSTTTIMSCTSL